MEMSSDQDSESDCHSRAGALDRAQTMAHNEDEDDVTYPPEYTDGQDRLLALCSFHAERADQLSIKSGDLVRLIERNESKSICVALSNSQDQTKRCALRWMVYIAASEQWSSRNCACKDIRECNHDRHPQLIDFEQAVYDPPPENQFGDERATASGIQEFHELPTGDEETRTITVRERPWQT